MTRQKYSNIRMARHLLHVHAKDILDAHPKIEPPSHAPLLQRSVYHMPTTRSRCIVSVTAPIDRIKAPVCDGNVSACSSKGMERFHRAVCRILGESQLPERMP